jgi:hypothetical protein
VDEAFLRRIRYKIALEDPSRREYREIFRLECQRLGVPMSDWAVEHLFREYYGAQGIRPRCCHPRDILEKIVDAARFAGTDPDLSGDLLDQVCASYFLTEETVHPL